MDCYLSPGSQLSSFPDAAQVALGGSTRSCLYNHALVCWQQTHLCLHWSRRSHLVHFPACNALFSVAHTRTLQNFQKVIFLLVHSREANKDPGAPFLIHHSHMQAAGAVSPWFLPRFPVLRAKQKCHCAWRCTVLEEERAENFVKELGHIRICQVMCLEPSIFISINHAYLSIWVYTARFQHLQRFERWYFG